MSYRARARKLAAESEKEALDALDRTPFQQPRWEVARAAPFVGAVIARHCAKAVGLADVALTAMLRKETGRALPTIGLGLPDGEVDRLISAVETVLDDANDPRPRLGRLARAEPLQAGRRAFHDAMKRRGIPGWTRRTGGTDVCPLCQQLDDGSVLPPTVPMATHPGCSCVATPVLTVRRRT